jgi:hypothetical protein
MDAEQSIVEIERLERIFAVPNTCRVQAEHEAGPFN